MNRTSGARNAGSAIRSHMQFGSNSGLYKVIGYVTDGEKKSGLHRKSPVAVFYHPAALVFPN